jgi:hypothetical protein
VEHVEEAGIRLGDRRLIGCDWIDVKGRRERGLSF